MSKGYIRIGQILRPQGIRGEVKVKILSENPERFTGRTELFLEERANYSLRKVTSSAVRGENAYICFEGVSDRNSAEMLRNAYVCLRREDIVLPEGRWLIDDLIGCKIAGDDGRDLGELKDILQYGAADVYVVKGGDRGFMMPALKKILKSVDIDKKIIVVDLNELEQAAVWDE